MIKSRTVLESVLRILKKNYLGYPHTSTEAQRHTLTETLTSEKPPSTSFDSHTSTHTHKHTNTHKHAPKVAKMTENEMCRQWVENRDETGRGVGGGRKSGAQATSLGKNIRRKNDRSGCTREQSEAGAVTLLDGEQLSVRRTPLLALTRTAAQSTVHPRCSFVSFLLLAYLLACFLSLSLSLSVLFVCPLPVRRACAPSIGHEINLQLRNYVSLFYSAFRDSFICLFFFQNKRSY